MKSAFDIELETVEPDDEQWKDMLKARNIKVIRSKPSPNGHTMVTYSSENLAALMILVDDGWHDNNLLQEIEHGPTHDEDMVRTVLPCNDFYDEDFQRDLRASGVETAPWVVENGPFDEYLFYGKRKQIEAMIDAYYGGIDTEIVMVTRAQWPKEE